MPTVFFQSMGVVLVGLYLPFYKPNSERVYALGDSRNVTFISLAVAGIGILTSPLLAIFAAPSLAAHFGLEIFWSSIWSWIGFFLVSLSFHYRIQLQSEGKSGMPASASLIFSTSFVAAMLFFLWIKLFTPTSPSVLTGAFCFSCVALLAFYTRFFQIKSLLFITVKKQLLSSPVCIVSNRIILGAFSVQFLLLIPRLLDRTVASGSGIGGIATLEYAYNIYTAAGMIIGTSAMIVLAQSLSGVFLKRNPVRNFCNLTWLSILISIIIAIFVYAYSRELVLNIYYRGIFTLENVENTNKYLIYLMFSFVPMVANMLLFQVLLACHRLVFIIIPTLIKIFLKVFLLFMLKNEAPEVAIGISTAVCEIGFLVIGLSYLKFSVLPSKIRAGYRK